MSADILLVAARCTRRPRPDPQGTPLRHVRCFARAFMDRARTLLVLAPMLAGCSSASATSKDAGVISPSGSTSQSAVACSQDAGLDGIYSTSSNDSRCPAQWADLTSVGIPNQCTQDGLICVYAEGQAECAPDGSVLKWWQNGAGQGCGEYPPVLCSPCSVPGNICEYIKGLPGLVSNFVATVCCNGNTKQWEVEPNNAGCPNGNVCGTIRASDYDQSCSTAADCTGVTQGVYCP